MFRKIFHLVVLTLASPLYADLVEDTNQPDVYQQNPSPTPTEKEKKTEDRILPIEPESNKKEFEKSAKSKKKNKKKPSALGDSDDKKIHFSSDIVRGKREEGVIELEKNVIVKQTNLELSAKQARLLFKNNSDQIDRVEAEGDVKIIRNEIDRKRVIRTQSEKGIYYNLSRKIILIGNAKLWHGDDLVTGKEIVYKFDTGLFEVSQSLGVITPEERKKTNGQRP